MKTKGRAEKWVGGVLGVVCLLLVMNLVLQLGGGRVGASRGQAPAGGAAGRHPAPGSAQSDVDELSRHDPAVRLDLLQKLQSRPLPEATRSPFGVDAPPKAAQPGTPAPATPSQPPPPPPTPPITLKALGYSEKGQGQLEAFVADDEQSYVVHEGETFAQRYRVLRITPKFIEVQDDSTHQTAQLPFAQ